jgi:hypothetical protein
MLLQLAQVVPVHQLVRLRQQKAEIQFLQPLHLKVAVVVLVLVTLLALLAQVVLAVAHLAGQQIPREQTEQQFKEQKAEMDYM